MHWRLASVPVLPTVPRIQSLAVSFNKESALLTRSYDTRQDCALDVALALNHTRAVNRSVSPVGENWSAKVCLVAVPQFGAMVSSDTVDGTIGMAVKLLSV